MNDVKQEKQILTEEQRRLVKKLRSYHNGSYALVLDKLMAAAQTEIIWCKDCKNVREWRSEEAAKKFGQIYECVRGVLMCPGPKDYCSKAKRKKENGEKQI